MVEHSAVNATVEHHKPLFWRRLATKPSSTVVPQLWPAITENLAKITLPGKHSRGGGLLILSDLFAEMDFPRNISHT
jgi:hypothetical protein